MRKVLFIILNGKPYGGSEKHVVDLINNVPKDYKIGLIMSSGNKMIDSIKQNNVRIYEVNRNSLLILKKIRKIISEFNPDIIHAHAARGMFVARLAAKPLIKKNKIKLICTAHGWVLNYLKAYKIKEKLFLLNRDLDSVTIAVSKTSMEEMINNGYDRNKMRYIYNGIHTKDYNKKARIKTELKNIGYIGRFTKQKGIEYLLETIKEQQKYDFWVYGDGEEKEKILNFIDNYSLENVSINGFIKPENVIDALKKIDVLLLPSIDEGFPYILVEAIASGVPCIATDVGGVSEIINEKTGALISPRDTEVIAEAIETVKKNIEDISRTCILESSKFDINIMIEKVVSVYKEVLNEQ